MKYFIYVLLSIALTASPVISQAADDMDACESVLCLAGLLQGESGGSACDGAIEDYFSIQVFKRGSFKPSATQKKRGNYLNGCESADAGWKSNINNTYGKLKVGF